VGLKRGPLSLVGTSVELLGRNSSGSGIEDRKYGRGVSVALTTLHPQSQKLALTSVGIVYTQTKATGFVVCCHICVKLTIPASFHGVRSWQKTL
jgi:hypothetical protein